MDYNFVTKRLATGGGLRTSADVDQLIADKITHIIDCCGEFNDITLLAAYPGISYLYNGTEDDGKPKPPIWFAKSIEFALQAFVEAHCRLYVHCAAGVNRGPSTAYAILLALGLPPTIAEQLIRSNRPQVGLAYKIDAEAAVIDLGYVSSGLGTV